MGSSMMAFHSPQDSQRPLHFGVTAPQDWQTNCEARLATAKGPFGCPGGSRS
jgi:hypothetical protein